MAKALYGHLVNTDARLVWENDRLRARVADLEAEVERLSLELAASPSIELDALPLDVGIEGDSHIGLRPALA